MTTPNTRVRRGDARPAAPIAAFEAITTTGTKSVFPIGRAVDKLGVEIKTGKTITFNVQGSLVGNTWVTLSTTTSSTSGKLVKLNWSTSATVPALARFRTIVKTLGAGTTGASAWLSV
jgi:hypothetical protein